MSELDAAQPRPVLAMLTGAELSRFNDHLAALAAAGLPLEQGVRLAAEEAGRRGVRKALHALADDLDAGVPLGEAFDRRRGAFPPAYAALMEAAVATGNLPALLLSLGRHQRTVAGMKAGVVRAMTYPLVVMIGVMAVATLMSTFVLPQLQGTLQMIHARSGLTASFGWYQRGRPPVFPWSTQTVMAATPYLPWIVGALLAVLLAIPVGTVVLRWLRLDGVAADWASGVPLVGPVLRNSALARFADALAVGVRAPVDLPKALRLAGRSVGYPRLLRDAEALAGSVEKGGGVGDVKLRYLPRTFAVAMDAGIRGGGAGLAGTLEALAALYRDQAELRAQRVPVVVLPVALAGLAAVVALLVAAIMAPISYMIRVLA